MTEATVGHYLDAVKVHITGSDVPAPKQSREPIHTTFSTQSVAKVIADGQPRLLLPLAPNRIRALLSVTSTAPGETIILAGSSGEAQTGAGATVFGGVLSGGLLIELRGADEVWLGQGIGASIVVGVIAEYA